MISISNHANTLGISNTVEFPEGTNVLSVIIDTELLLDGLQLAKTLDMDWNKKEIRVIVSENKGIMLQSAQHPKGSVLIGHMELEE